MRRIGAALAGILIVAVVAWGTLAVYFRGPGPHAVVAAAYAAVVLGVAAALRSWPRRLVALAALFVATLLWWSTIRPSNDRDWLPEVARLPAFDVDGTRLVAHGVRNFDYRIETDFRERWEDRTYDLARLRGLDLFMSYWASPAIAHTVLSWDFDDGEHLAISIETRKERGEEYSTVRGFFREYELYYVVADERDVIRLRTNYRHENVYLYRLRTPVPRARALLLDYIASINGLATQPIFYNALTDNCTTTIRNHMRNLGDDRPLDWRFLANGYADQMLYESGALDTRLPFAELRERSSIDARAQAADQAPDFAARIRDGLPNPRLPPS
ncbi:MAG: DUF4105 domain-containing protein [Deltaproteobacteria bacterium]|nr:DUF4105 domain-containing protein [Deltaproteobacteria bacterium]